MPYENYTYTGYFSYEGISYEDIYDRATELGCNHEILCYHDVQLSIDNLIKKVAYHIKRVCNLETIPDELRLVAIDMICGMLFKEQKAAHPDILYKINLDECVRQIQEGDTNIQFNSSSPEKRFDDMIDYLISFGEREIISYRRIRW